MRLAPCRPIRIRWRSCPRMSSAVAPGPGGSSPVPGSHGHGFRFSWCRCPASSSLVLARRSDRRRRLRGLQLDPAPRRHQARCLRGSQENSPTQPDDRGKVTGPGQHALLTTAVPMGALTRLVAAVLASCRHGRGITSAGRRRDGGPPRGRRRPASGASIVYSARYSPRRVVQTPSSGSSRFVAAPAPRRWLSRISKVPGGTSCKPDARPGSRACCAMTVA